MSFYPVRTTIYIVRMKIYLEKITFYRVKRKYFLSKIIFYLVVMTLISLRFVSCYDNFLSEDDICEIYSAYGIGAWNLEWATLSLWFVSAPQKLRSAIIKHNLIWTAFYLVRTSIYIIRMKIYLEKVTFYLVKRKYFLSKIILYLVVMTLISLRFVSCYDNFLSEDDMREIYDAHGKGAWKLEWASMDYRNTVVCSTSLWLHLLGPLVASQDIFIKVCDWLI